MKLQDRISLLTRLGDYMQSQEPEWLAVQERASRENGWFIPSFITTAVNSIASNWLTQKALTTWVESAEIPNQQTTPYNVGLVMAGNIPLVGFHDWLCVFVTGHHAQLKLSSKDNVLISHLINKLLEWAPQLAASNQMTERLTGCDAYLATGSTNSSRYFNYYFGKYPHIIRKTRPLWVCCTGMKRRRNLNNWQRMYICILVWGVEMLQNCSCQPITTLYPSWKPSKIQLAGRFSQIQKQLRLQLSVVYLE